jgi:hypothetical protein
MTAILFSWNILSIWLLTRCNTNHHGGSSYVNTFVVWPHGPGQLQNFFNHLNSLQSSNQFLMDTVRQCNSISGCSDHRERDDTEHHIIPKTHTHTHTEADISISDVTILTWENWGSIICQEGQGLFTKISNLIHDFQLSCSSQGQVINSDFSSLQSVTQHHQNPLESTTQQCSLCYTQITHFLTD